ENWKASRRWTFVATLFAISIGVNYVAALKNWQPISAIWLYFLPLVFSAVLLGPLATYSLGGIIVTLCLLGLATSNMPAWFFLTFNAGLGLNAWGWQRWTQSRDRMSFTLLKNTEELEINMNDTQIALEKVKVALQANQMKIQRYTALNELARNL